MARQEFLVRLGVAVIPRHSKGDPQDVALDGVCLGKRGHKPLLVAMGSWPFPASAEGPGFGESKRLKVSAAKNKGNY